MNVQNCFVDTYAFLFLRIWGKPALIFEELGFKIKVKIICIPVKDKTKQHMNIVQLWFERKESVCTVSPCMYK